MTQRRLSNLTEHAACGVGFVALKRGEPSRVPLLQALHALDCVEHRGGSLADGITGDGAGIMADIPFDLLGFSPGEIALGTVFISDKTGDNTERILEVLSTTFEVAGIELLARREVPIATRVLGPQAAETLPVLLQIVFAWPAFCRSSGAFSRLLYMARQRTRTRLQRMGLGEALHFVSLSTQTVVYKALCRSTDLAALYPDLRNSSYRTRFAVFHRRFSTNTRTGWSRAQPFRLIAHNGEINTIAGNRSWAYSREQALGLPPGELLSRGASDSGNLNQMVEALKYRSSMPYVEDAMAIMIPPADVDNDYYRFWGRAAEPWDGPAMVVYCDGEAVGARIDRNGFRPCRWAETADAFYLASEAGVFGLDEAAIRRKGSLRAGTAVKLILGEPTVQIRDPSHSAIHRTARFHHRLQPLVPVEDPKSWGLADRARLFGLTSEELKQVLVPMMATGKEPIGSMGNTARLAVLSTQRRPLFDYFFQNFAQVTNPPLDYLRERIVTNLTVSLGRVPNIFVPKELIPPRAALHLDSPVLDPGQLATLLRLSSAQGDADAWHEDESELPQLAVQVVQTCFDRAAGPAGMRHALDRIADDAHAAVTAGASILILSDLAADDAHPPVPSLLALRAVIIRLNQWGLRLRTSVVIATGEARTTHHLAALISFGAAAVCPAMAFELAAASADRRLAELSIAQRTERLRQALESGLLKIMSKMGISVVRSYQSTKLFTAVGVGDEIIGRYFPGLCSVVGGVGLDQLAADVLRWTEPAAEQTAAGLVNARLFREHPRGSEGERHSMTSALARSLHKLLAGEGRWQDYLDQGAAAGPVSLRHLLELTPAAGPLPVDEVEPAAAIMRRFCSGAMSFGAISAESQRDIILGMRAVGGRSNSGEGGENPFYYTDGISASVKQVASGRFGVTAEFLVTGDEVEIKIAQGAKPGEGGQLMGVKVDAQIARARRASPGISLISPPPQHDIYSIEDLKELIYEIKQLDPDKPVAVKLVAGANVGTIAVGVAKAGADAILISGGDGGTGAAPISSMMHAGLPWELGLAEVQRALCDNQLRGRVRLRVDGGLLTGADIVKGAALGADDFGFGKLLLVAEGCIMARVCQSNTCPRGIATHDPKFKARYRGGPDEVAATLRLLAEDVRRELAAAGLRSLDELVGRSDLLREVPSRRELIRELGLMLDGLLEPAVPVAPSTSAPPVPIQVSALNRRIVEEARPVLTGAADSVACSLPIRSRDRGVLARVSGLCGERVARLRAEARLAGEPAGELEAFDLPAGSIRLSFEGSAGQGFGVFLTAGLDVHLAGEANDSVCKAMSGGRVVIQPAADSPTVAEDNVIIGNCALYGATGGQLLVSGRAGDRFAVRNSGAVAVIDGAGMHACEYMTGGTVVITGPVSHNVGAGMTGGTLYLHNTWRGFVNDEYLVGEALDDGALAELVALLDLHTEATGSAASQRLLADRAALREDFRRYKPVSA